MQGCEEGLLEDVDLDLGKVLSGCAKLQKYSRQNENVKRKTSCSYSRQTDQQERKLGSRRSQPSEEFGRDAVE